MWVIVSFCVFLSYKCYSMCLSKVFMKTKGRTQVLHPRLFHLDRVGHTNIPPALIGPFSAHSGAPNVGNYIKKNMEIDDMIIRIQIVQLIG